MNPKLLKNSLRLCLLAFTFMAAGLAAEVPEERRPALDDAQAGTVSIQVRGPVNEKSQYKNGSGTGFIVARNKNRAIIATNCHLACNQTWIWVTTYNDQKRRVHARFITGDRTQDIALISIPAFKGMTTLPLMDGVPEQGEQAIAIGSPLGVRWSVTAGIFSVLNRTDLNYPTPNGVHQTDAAINPGNSGGPLLVFRDGEYTVAGMNTFRISSGGGNTGIAFAVPSSDVIRVLNAQVLGQSPARNTLGGLFNAIGSSLAEILGVPTSYRDQGVNGVYIKKVVPDGPLASAGIEEGDVLLQLNSTKLRSLAVFRSALYEADPHLPIRLVYLRHGQVKQASVMAKNAWGQGVERNRTNQSGPSGNSSQGSQQTGQTTSNPLRAFGFAVLDNTTPAYRRLIGRGHPETSPVVVQLVNQGAAHYAGVQRGFYLKAIAFKGLPPTAVATIEDIRALFEKAASMGIDTEKAAFVFTAYQLKGRKLYKKRLSPVVLDANNVPPPA